MAPPSRPGRQERGKKEDVMAANIAAGQATQVAQQQAAQKPEAAPKTGASKFDEAMANKANEVTATERAVRAQSVQATAQIQKTTHVDQVTKAGKADETKQANAVKQNAPVEEPTAAAKPRSSIEGLLTGIEGRNAAMDRFINQAMGGKLKLSQQQLLGLQAKVSQYSLELDLTGKVVEKATSGLKDTLRTQV